MIPAILIGGLITTGAWAESALFDKTFKKDGITYHVIELSKGGSKMLRIEPQGLQEVNEPVEQKIDGTVTGAEVADLNGDKAPEIYIYVTSPGSGSYGSLVAYSSNHNLSMTEIYLPPLDPKSKEARGYMGHDRFKVQGHTLVRSFPVYKEGDPNCCPTGGERRLYYKLIPGEAGWILQLSKTETVAKK